MLRNRYNKRRRLLETRLASESGLRVSESELRTEYSILRKVTGVPTIFQHREIEEATDGFKSKNFLGKGASGSVFKGILEDGTPVAVKQIEGSGEKQFRSEVAAIASVQHVNLVRLLGYCCVPTGPRFLVYDFIPNGSLEKWIFPRKEKEKSSSRGKIQHVGGCLDWCSRVRVALDVAKALSYLHHDCRSKILHFDVKPENILLDQNYRGFVSDFGLSKLMGLDESRIVTNKMRPSMAQVVEMLEGRAAGEEPPETEMLMDSFLSYDEGISSSHDSSGIGASPVTPGDDSVHSSASCSIYLSSWSRISSSQDSSGIGASPVTQGNDSVHSSASCSIYLSSWSGRSEFCFNS
ncbi:hypothetical protein RHGRI_000672 [Rhododendron griersonianum]|uniref:Protein kinase domain-containing protein n=1 Tax=Rhododendron griersonianum TaxID=479676 RepID=A0AAV6LKD9_9ERIC|nr:hypothetical protein RHGRI_000672 [Rhododendron griersonianum]